MCDGNEYQKAREYALNRLSRRECSTEDLRRKLAQRGVQRDLVNQVIQELESSQLVDNQRFAKMLIRQQASQTKGPRFIRQKLKEQGISMEVEEVTELSQDLTQISELEAAKGWVERRYPKAWEDPKVKLRASQALLRRGFSYSLIKEVFNSRPL